MGKADHRQSMIPFDEKLPATKGETALEPVASRDIDIAMILTEKKESLKTSNGKIDTLTYRMDRFQELVDK